MKVRRRFAANLRRWGSTTSAGVSIALVRMHLLKRFSRPIGVEIEEMKRRGGYVTADVIDVNSVHAESRDDAGEVRQGTHARRGRGALYPCRSRDFLSEYWRAGSLRWKSVPAICCVCLAERRTGLRSARIAASAPFAGFRTRPAGLRITPDPALTRATSRCASDPAYFGPRAATGVRV